MKGSDALYFFLFKYIKEAFEKPGWCVFNTDEAHFTVQVIRKDLYILVTPDVEQAMLLLLFYTCYDVVKLRYIICVFRRACLFPVYLQMHNKNTLLYKNKGKGKGKMFPLQATCGPKGGWRYSSTLT